MKRWLSSILILVCFLTMFSWPLRGEATSFTCSDHSECTEGGGEIYIITKDNCPIRKEPHNKGAVVGRGKKGQLISVTDVFWTMKMTRWCEISVVGSNEKLYVHIDNVAKHAHSYIRLLTNKNGYVDFCPVCGYSFAKGKRNATTCDLTCVAEHAIGGSFSSSESTFYSILVEILAAEALGPVADVRDLVGDILNGEAGWVIGADIVALIPIVGAVKYADEIAILGKRGNDVAKLANQVSKIPWGKWSDYQKVTRNGREYAKIGEFYYTRHAVDEFLNPSIETNLIGKVEHSRGVPPSWVNWVLTEGVDIGTTKVVKDGANRMKYVNGSLEVIVENGDTVVTIYTK